MWYLSEILIGGPEFNSGTELFLFFKVLGSEILLILYIYLSIKSEIKNLEITSTSSILAPSSRFQM